MRIIKTASLTLFTIIALWLAGYAAFIASILSIEPQQPDMSTEAVIVFTGGNHRIKTGLELLAHNKTQNLFISGVNPDVTRWSIISQWQNKPALPSCCIELGKDAKTTLENAQEAKQWIEKKNFSTVRLVTSNYHMHRALLEMRNALPEVEIVRHPVMIPDYQPDEEKFWRITFSEYNKTLFRWMQIHTQPGQT